MEDKKIKKILVINPFGIGDVLFTTPVVRALRQNFPEGVIAYWCNERVKEVLKHNKNIDIIFALSRGDLKRLYKKSKVKALLRLVRLLKDIKGESFDIAIDFSLDYRYSFFTQFLGIKKRIGFNYKNRGKFLTDTIPIESYSSKHVVEFYLDLLRFLNIQPQTKDLDLSVSPINNVKGKYILSRLGIKEGDTVIGIAPGVGASWGKDAAFKRWPAIRFTQLSDKIISELGAKVVILGDESERDIADFIMYSMRYKAIDLVGKTNIEEFVSLINNVDLLVANDGGPLHCAVALGKKTVSIFGPVDDAVYGPFPPSNRHIVVKKDLTCRPCYQKFKLGACERDRACINTILTEEVFDAIRRLL
ncbi:MAG: lipopolysaccharide heptosyltransferase II [Candidatus Omnitrophota bacterium]|jgi:heptosyltransferase-2